MKEAVYENQPIQADGFEMEWDSLGRLVLLRHPQDVHGTNWVEGRCAFGTVKSDLDLSVHVKYSFTKKGTVQQAFTFCNDTDYDIYAAETALGITVCFPDYYTDAAVCMERCCHTHIWCGGGFSYICALRMGGGPYNCGLVLTEGSLQGYSVDRDTEMESNDRGCFLLHPEDFRLLPGESYTIAWELFWFDDKEAFRRRLTQYPGYMEIRAERFVLYEGESAVISLTARSADGNAEKPRILKNGKEIPCTLDGGTAVLREPKLLPGVYEYQLAVNGRESRTSLLVCPTLKELAERRCRFIARKQQCHDAGHLNGAYLIYDNETKRQYYSHALPDHNGGRERIGMGALLALYLQRHPDTALEQSLEDYISYIIRELFDTETGEVYNDAGRSRDQIRPYNYPWIAALFLEMFNLKRERHFLDWACRCLFTYYSEGGGRFYAIGIPMFESVSLLRREGMEARAERLLLSFREHGDYLVKCGTHFPAHEVKYEQSIVAPAAIYLCDLYRLTGEEKYRTAAVMQLKLLDLFQGFQPDYHQNEVAIRHWDGYWFGKRRCYGDTFPHYWSALSGIAFRNTKVITGTDYYEKKAEKTLRGVLSMFREDGSASCAMVYPMSVNVCKTGYYDPWANDQDWGLYYVMKYGAHSW